ncbi:hypothetical protein BK010_04500 [Tenericutes bacterium MO-XQ]|nr:hypothetical protein BK010_04500 [Tenericutes bacterium MO-XQ]
MKKFLYVILLLSMIILPSACKKDETDPNDPKTDVPETIETISGLENKDVIVGHYFDPLEDVKIMTNKNRNVAHLFEITGHVNYGVTGSYTLTYNLSLGDETINETREIEVVEGTYQEPTGQRSTTSPGQQSIGFGSYYEGSLSAYDHPMTPAFIEADLQDTAVPSSGWWTSLLVSNYGGSNGIYTNLLRASYTNEGLEITNPEDGFVQYWNVNQTPTMAQFPLALKDTFLKSSDLDLGYLTKVIGYSDASVKVAMRNVGDSTDHMVTTLTQGSPYVFVEVANEQSLTYTFDTNGLDNYEYYDLNGNLITSSTYTGKAIIVNW